MTALPSLRQLRYVVALDELRSFTRAAQACFVTQSTLSAGLKELERLLGVCLVERDRQNVVMTPVGAEIAVRARELLAAAEDLVEHAGAASEPMSRLLRLGAIPTIAPFLLPRWLPALRERYPRLRLALREDTTVALLERLREARLDFALIALPFDCEGLLVEPLFRDPLRLVACRADPLLRARRVEASAIADRLLLLEEGHCLREHTLQACPHAGRSAQPIEATSLLTLVQMIESGMGCALVPELALGAGLLERTGLASTRLRAPEPERTIALVARRSTAQQREFALLAESLRALQGTPHEGGSPRARLRR
jgi:LysR family hydrogen peroxide-inducible transcriptional activator